jgi:glycosyltransferase involved in cell wall biosynthesis
VVSPRSRQRENPPSPPDKGHPNADVVVVSYFNAKDVTGGAERIAWTEAELLAATHKVLFVSTSAPTGEARFAQYQLAAWTRRLYQPTTEARRNPLLLGLFHLLSLFNPAAFVQALWLFRRVKPATVHTHNLVALSPAMWLAARLAGARAIHTHHDLWALCEYATMTDSSGRPCNEAQPVCRLCRALRPPKRAQLRLVSTEIFPSRWLRDRLGRRGEIIPSFATTYHSQVSEPVSSGSTVAYVGLLAPHKLGALLDAFEALPATAGPPIRLVIAGSGPMSEAVTSAAEVNPCVEYLGPLDADARDRMLAQAALLVIPSTCTEGSPLVFFEALAAGLPVVGSDVGGITELQRFGNVVLVPPGDASRLAQTLVQLVGDGEWMGRLQEAARRHRSEASPARYRDAIRDVFGPVRRD